MALFQQKILDNYLKQFNNEQIDKAYKTFCSYFQNIEIQNNILQSKEEQFQEGFLRDLFANILGYTLYPNPHYNLVTEKKDTTDSKKADAAILKGNEVIAVIELKSHKTIDLDKVKDQAFAYKHQHKMANYVIISNFQKVRFYIDNSIDFMEWDLFQLNLKEFQQMWLCLSANALMQDLPKKVKNESISKEEQITNQLYKDYITFKRELFSNILKHNTTQEGEQSTKEWKILLFKKTQKLLDRLLFILFAQDSGLLQFNTIEKIIERWEILKSNDEYRPLYSLLIKHFGKIDTGQKDDKTFGNIFAYNGGLFKEDKTLDSLEIEDEVLRVHLQKISSYDFESDVDVNILGHIFENSLSEIEEITAQLEEGQAEEQGQMPTLSKRKKDGVFYTPQYITKYIVENTLGRLCNEKKLELGLNEENYYNTEKKISKEKRKAMEEVLNLYRQWLLQLTICDPACGSGAFLNATLRFLMEEHHKLDEMATYIMGREDGRLIFPDVENDILEKNLYGVDINEESVEIARLSLWLRTAKPYRKLSSLNDNIKCGNSLISDSSVDREKAFDWEKEFPQVFQKGGFDVVIGNPPYLRIQGMRQGHNNEVPFYEQHFMSATGKFDYYVLFMEKGFSLIKEKGLLSYILPHKFITASFGVGIRSFIAKHRALKSLLHFGAEQVFDLASVYTCIITLSKNNNEFEYARVKPSHLMNSSMVLSTLPISTIADAQKWNLQEEESATILEKLDQCPLRLQDIYKSCSAGIVSMGDDLYMMKGRIEGDYFIGFSEKCNKEIKIESQIVRPILKGEDVKRYSCPQNEYYMIYPHYLEDGKTCTYTEEELKTNFPLCYEYLLPYKEDLVKKKIYSKENPIYWYGLHRPRKISMFEQKKIITAEISLGCNMTIDENNLYHNTKVYTIDLKEEYKSSMYEILAILNSKIMWYYISNTGYTLRGGFFCFKTRYIENFPIPDITSKEDALREKSVFMLRTTAELGKIRSCFHRRMKENFELRKVSKMLETADDLSFAEFLKELKKQKVKLSLVQQDEWEEYFSQYKEKCLNLRDALRKMEKEIDTLVYALYGLTEEEIKVVEGSIK